MADTIKKNRFRVLQYAVHLFIHEFILGNAPQKHRFMTRIVRRVFEKFGLYHLFAFCFRGYFQVFAYAQPKRLNYIYQNYPLWIWATLRLENKELLRNWVANEVKTEPHIVVLSTGSVGDILQITPLLRTLREKVPSAKIALLHRSPAVKTVLKGNPHIDMIEVADFYQFAQIKRAVEIDGAADLVVDIKSMSFVVTYTRAPKEKRHPLFDAALPDSFFATVNKIMSKWVSPRGFERKDGTFAWPEEWKNIQYLDVLGMTSNLNLNAHSPLDFYSDESVDQLLGPVFRDYPMITIQSGVDADVLNWSYVTGQRPTKLLPMDVWKKIVEALIAKNFKVVQLGTKEDSPIEGVTLDLRGQTSLAEAGALLKKAYCHLGTEGGLVHLAHAMGKKSVVLFGPTSPTFLGYANNINLTASDCSSCWGLEKDWSIYCPRGFVTPPCMDAFRAQMVVDAVENIERTNLIKTVRLS